MIIEGIRRLFSVQPRESRQLYEIGDKAGEKDREVVKFKAIRTTLEDYTDLLRRL